MFFDLPSVVQNAENFDHGFPQAVNQKMTRILHRAQCGTGALTAEAQVVDSHVRRKFRAPKRSGPQRILADVSQRLIHEGIVPERGIFAEFLQAPA
jgi:hypothetical protein